MTAEEIEEAFRPRGVSRGGLLMLRPLDAVAMVRQAKEQGVRVLGAEAFCLFDHGTQPMLEHSVDFSSSSVPWSQDPWNRAVVHLERYLSCDCYFEVVLE